MNFPDDLYYNKISKCYVWKQSSRSWERRKRFYKKQQTLNRLHLVHIEDKERYFFRILLHKVPNPTCFEDLRTFEGVLYNTFQEACHARGFLDNDTQWDDTIKEAIRHFPPNIARKIFTYILAYSNPSHPLQLWVDNKEQLCEDFMRNIDTTFNPFIEQKGLNDINENLKQFQKSLHDYSTMPQIEEDDNNNNTSLNNITNSYNIIKMYKKRSQESYINAEPEKQKVFLKEIFDIFDQKKNNFPTCYFLNAAAGCGKTYCLDAIIDKCKSIYGEESVLVVSSTAISAQQFKNQGKTAHSTFKLPVHYVDPRNIRCGIKLD
jgi:ATP-dependent DNA helicase PIF1